MTPIEKKAVQLKKLIDDFAVKNNVDVACYATVSKTGVDITAFKVVRFKNTLKEAVICNNELSKIINETQLYIMQLENNQHN